MIDSYKALRDLFSEKLNGNTTETLFDVSLYNSEKTKYTQDFDENDGVTVTTKRIVPTNIVEIVGNYINIPNTSVTENAISLEFDIFVGDYDRLPVDRQDEFKSVDYYNTLASVENFRKELLAKYYPLGEIGLYFGGTDSKSNFSFTTGFKYNTIYMKLDLKNTDTETLLYADDGASGIFQLTKTATNIVLDVDGVTVSIPYSIGLNDIYVYYDAQDSWNLTVNGTNNSVVDLAVQNTYTSGVISTGEDFNGILYQLLIDDAVISSPDVSNVTSPLILLNDFDSRYSLTNNGSIELTVGSIDNCILWGEDGNAVFSFETLIPIGEIDFGKDGAPYQMFGLAINSMISQSVVFGNNFEYFLDGNQIYPVDRQVSYSAEPNSEQYINDNYATTLNLENAKDFSQTFYYEPSKQLTNLFKHITGNAEEQNKTYELIVQYPFYKVTYDVIIDGGGNTQNINELSTITLTYKQADEILIP